MMLRAIATMLIVAGLAAGCASTTYPRTTYYTTAPTTTYVYVPTDRASCEAAGGRWHMFSATCTIPR